MPSSVIAEPRPKKPMPWRRLRTISSRCCASGRPLTSTTLSSIRVNTLTTSRNSSQSKYACSLNGAATNFVRLIEPSRHAPYARQRLLAAGISGANVLAPPVVVHLVDAIDEHEAGLGEVVRRRHDDVPHAPRRQRSIDAAGDEPAVVDDVVVLRRPLAPDDLLRIVEVDVLFLGLAPRQRKRELPRLIGLHGLHELVGDQQRQIELAQPAVLALGANEIHRIGMADVERAHLRAAPPAGRRDREAHLVVDIHERQRAGRVGARAADVSAARPQRRELVADAAAGLQREARPRAPCRGCRASSRESCPTPCS